MADRVAEHFVAPLGLAGDRLGVGIEQKLGPIEAVAGGGFIGPVDPKAIMLPRPHVGEEGVPDMVVLFRQPGGRSRFSTVRPVEEAEIDPRRVLGKEREIHPVAAPGGAQGVSMAFPDA